MGSGRRIARCDVLAVAVRAGPLAVAAAGAPAATGGAAKRLAATLSARQTVPRPTWMSGTGTFIGVLRGEQLTFTLTYRRLTGRVLSAHIHFGELGKANPRPVALLCQPCRTGETGVAAVPGWALPSIVEGRAYVDLHTRRNPRGEIRGQIAVPLR